MTVMDDITATEQLNRLRDELFAATAHAIKTPVAIIKTAAQVLSRTAPSTFQESAEIIVRQSARIDALVENLFAFSRIRSGTLQLHRIDVELAPLVEHVAGRVGAVSDGYEIRVYLDDHPRIRADHERIAMVLRNTIEAAVRSSRAGEPVTIRLRRCDRDTAIEVSYKPDESGGRYGEAQEATEFDEIGVRCFVTTTIVEAHGGTVTGRNDRDRATLGIQLPALSEEDV